MGVTSRGQYPVELRVYDISDGLARRWSPIILGRRIEGIWHSGLLVFGYEYFYGGGIIKMKPEDVERNYRMAPINVHFLGYTQSAKTEFERYLLTIMQMFRRECYDLLKWNCNNFSNHVTKFLLGKSIPGYITDLPEEVEKTFMGKIILNFLKAFNGEAPISSDDPLHPKQILSKEETEFEFRQRRNSCPGSPTRQRFPLPEDQNETERQETAHRKRVQPRRSSVDTPQLASRRELPERLKLSTKSNALELPLKSVRRRDEEESDQENQIKPIKITFGCRNPPGFADPRMQPLRFKNCTPIQTKSTNDVGGNVPVRLRSNSLSAMVSKANRKGRRPRQRSVDLPSPVAKC